MGKCTKKAKMTADVALTDVSHSYLGVRTHTKTLPLRRLPTAAASKPDLRLEKTMHPKNSRRSCGCRGKEDAEIGIHEELSPPDSTQGEGLGIEASFGENNLDFHVRQRTCWSPPAHEVEEFFAREEQSIHRHFLEKYNFDIVRDLALHGRYEWVALPLRP
ncbi:cyclin-dependent kinase inhibitor 3-like [Salvia miltiorrhiza]|uniref:cyclin-dependent kinase inhibitor 3-like n=1 Tax=Salvia miltiorrhiza TaxID=226208 RepID=UPI0025ACF6DF|nr:cyclin-dependent kinase inhibitor 3-like [Salvia miltiorrhiza]